MITYTCMRCGQEVRFIGTLLVGPTGNTFCPTTTDKHVVKQALAMPGDLQK